MPAIACGLGRCWIESEVGEASYNRVDHLGNLMATGSYTPPPAQLYALFPESL